MPVTGDIFDGPEWGQQPYTNMFAADAGSVDPKIPVNTVFSSFLRAHGGTVIGSYGYGISPTSSRGATSAERAFQSEGGKVGVLDTSIPLGSTAFTPVALVAKQHGVNAVFAAMDNDSNVALATALSQAGVRLKSVVFPTGYGPSLITSPAWKSVQGDYFVSELRPADVPDAGTVRLTDALQKYEHRPSSQFYRRVHLRSLGRRRSHAEGDRDGRCQPNVGGGDPQPAQHYLLQRRRARCAEHRLRDEFRSRSGQDVSVVPQGGEDKVCRRVDSAVVRKGHTGYLERRVAGRTEAAPGA